MSIDPAPIFTSTKDLLSHLKKARPGVVVLANGCFDPMHVGHIRYLDGARALGDFVVVALNDDRSTAGLKGSDRPIVPEGDRAQILAGLSSVDAVLIFGDDDVSAILAALRPKYHAKGTDYTVETVPEREVAKRLGISTAIVGDAKTHASRDVLKRMRGKS